MAIRIAVSKKISRSSSISQAKNEYDLKIKELNFKLKVVVLMDYLNIKNSRHYLTGTAVNCYLKSDFDIQKNYNSASKNIGKKLGVNEREIISMFPAICEELHTLGGKKSNQYNLIIDKIIAEKVQLKHDLANQQIYLKEQEVLQQSFLTEQEREKVKQEAEKALQEEARRNALEKSALDSSSGQRMTGVGKNILFIGGISLLAITIGFGLFKLISRKN